MYALGVVLHLYNPANCTICIHS